MVERDSDLFIVRRNVCFANVRDKHATIGIQQIAQGAESLQRCKVFWVWINEITCIRPFLVEQAEHGIASNGGTFLLNNVVDPFFDFKEYGLLWIFVIEAN